VPNASAACWIPAFAGMTAVEDGGGESGQNKNAAPKERRLSFVVPIDQRRVSAAKATE